MQRDGGLLSNHTFDFFLLVKEDGDNCYIKPGIIGVKLDAEKNVSVLLYIIYSFLSWPKKL